jgi:hypothetical protein
MANEIVLVITVQGGVVCSVHAFYGEHSKIAKEAENHLVELAKMDNPDLDDEGIDIILTDGIYSHKDTDYLIYWPDDTTNC